MVAARLGQPVHIARNLPSNRRLLDPALDKGSPFARRLLLRWGRLHAVRSVLSGCALVVFGECLNRMA